MSEAYKDKRFLYINSANRLSGTSSAFSIGIQLPAEEEYDSCVVTQVNIPISYYLVPASGNTFILTELGVSTTLSIPPGNYNINSFCTIVAALLTSGSAFGWVYTMTYPTSYTQPNTGLITYGVSSNSGQPSLTFNRLNYLNEQFGFVNNSKNTFVNNTLVSTTVVNFVNENTLFLHSDIVSNGSDDTLIEIYGQNNQALSYMTFLCPEIKGYSKRLKTPKSQIMNIYLTDENNKPINLNGQEMQFTLLCYRRGEFKATVTKFIEMCKTFIQYITEHISQNN